jgi:L-asparaginase / beta-aspartyl-peptidase
MVGRVPEPVILVSVTGTGEHIIRTVTAHEVAALRGHAGLTLEEACERALDHVAALGGEAGLIAVDAAGGVALPFNTGAMYRGLSRVGAAPVTATLPGEL